MGLLSLEVALVQGVELENSFLSGCIIVLEVVWTAADLVLCAESLVHDSTFDPTIISLSNNVSVLSCEVACDVSAFAIVSYIEAFAEP